MELILNNNKLSHYNFKSNLFNYKLKINLLAIFMGLGLAIPQWNTFGIPLGFAYIYFEEIMMMLLFLITINDIILERKVYRESVVFVFLWLCWISIGVLNGLYLGNKLTDILRDLRIPLCYLCFIPFIVKLDLNINEIKYIINSSIIGISIFTALDVLSVMTNSLLMKFRDPSQSMGLDRLVFSNEIFPIFFTPLIIWGVKKRFWSKGLLAYIIMISLILIFISMRRGLLGLLVLGTILTGVLGLGFKEKMKLMIILLLCTILSIPFFVRSELYERITNIFEGSEDSTQVRIYGIITNSIKIMEKPLTGYGFGSIMVVSEKGVHDSGTENNSIDNSFIVILYKVGVAGFLLWFLWIFYLFKKVDLHQSIVKVYLFLWLLFAIISAYLTNGYRTICYLIIILILIREININSDLLLTE